MTPIVATGLASLAGKAIEHFLPQRSPAAPQANAATAARFDAVMKSVSAAALSASPSRQVTAASLTEQIRQWPAVQDTLKSAGDAKSLEISSSGSLSVRLEDGTTDPVNISPAQRMELLHLRDLSAASAGQPLVLEP